MNERKYWLTVWSLTTWREFLKAGGTVYGLPARYENRIKQTSVGDFLICYMRGTGRSEFFAVLEITSAPFWNNKQIWSEEIYPVRLNVKVIVQARHGIKFKAIFERLSLFKKLKDPSNHRCWSNHFHQSLRLWNEQDAMVVYEEIAKAPLN